MKHLANSCPGVSWHQPPNTFPQSGRYAQHSDKMPRACTPCYRLLEVELLIIICSMFHYYNDNDSKCHHHQHITDCLG